MKAGGVWPNTIIFALSSIVAIVVGEFLVASFSPQSLGVWGMTRDGITSHVPNLSVYMHQFNQEISINSHGMRDQEHVIQKPPGVYRILVLGDSFMEALQLPFEESFPSLLERHLSEATSRTIEVINASVSGWGTDDELTYLMRYGTQFQPDLVLVAMTLHNDISDNLDEEFHGFVNGQLVQKPEEPIPVASYAMLRMKSYLASHSHLYQLVLRTWRRKGNTQAAVSLSSHVARLIARDPDKEIMDGWSMTKALLDKIKSETYKSGAKVCVFLLPLSIQVSDSGLSEFLRSRGITAEQVDINLPQRIMNQWGGEEQVPVIDLLPDFKNLLQQEGLALFLEDDGHWNKEGHRVATAVVTKRLLQEKLVGNKNGREHASMRKS